MIRIRCLLLTMIVMLTVPVVLIGTAGAAPQGRLVYWVQVDVVRGHEQPTGTVCVQTGVFKHGELIVWRINVFETASGRHIGNEGKNIAEINERGLKATVYLQNGTSLVAKYDKHPPRGKEGEPVRYFWTTSWQIPNDYPTGTLRWWVIVTDKAGAFVRYDPIGAGTSLPSSGLIIEKR